MLEREAPAETALIRGGEKQTLLRIQHLKATAAAHERSIALLTASLSAQHELLNDVTRSVATLAKALPKDPAALKARPAADWEAVVSAVHQLHHRLQKGAAQSAVSPMSASPASSPRVRIS